MSTQLIDRYKSLESDISNLQTEKVRLEERLKMLAVQKDKKLKEAGVSTVDELKLKVATAESELENLVRQWEVLLS